MGLCAALVAVLPAFAMYGFWRAGASGVLSSVIAAAICGGAALTSLLLTAVAQKAKQPISGILTGMVVRMAVPLVALLVIPKMNPALLQSGMQEMLLGYYLLALVAETWILLRLIPSVSSSSAKAA